MEKVPSAADLDAPIAKCVDINWKEGKFSDNPTIEGIALWIKEVNPNYAAFDIEFSYNVNCRACAYVAHERLNGNDAVCASANNIPTDPEMEKLLGKKIVSMSPQDIEKRLLEQGEGVHAVIGVNRAHDLGHRFNATCIEGRIAAIDGQFGKYLIGHQNMAM